MKVAKNRCTNFHHTLDMLLHYLVKCKRWKIAQVVQKLQYIVVQTFTSTSHTVAAGRGIRGHMPTGAGRGGAEGGAVIFCDAKYTNIL